MTRGERNVEWIESYVYDRPGHRIELLPHQRGDILKLYDNPHGTRRAIFSYGRKNGKTWLVAAIVLLHLVGPEAVANDEIYSAARSKDQAGQVYKFVKQFVLNSPEIGEYVGLRDHKKEAFCPQLNTLYVALSADAKTKLGSNPRLIIHDELGQVEGPTDALYDALETATAAQPEALTIIISTQAPRDTDLLSILIDDAMSGADPCTVCSLYTAPMKSDSRPDAPDAFSEEALRLANPAFGLTQSAKELLRMAADAKRMPAREGSYRNLILNQRYEATGAFITRELWASCLGEVGEPADGFYVGIDLSEVNDLTAYVKLWKKPDGKICMRSKFWAPGDKIRERSARDKVPYDVWAKQGHLQLINGPSIDYANVAEEVAKLLQDPKLVCIGFDRYNWRHFRKELLRVLLSQGIGEARASRVLDDKFKPIGQGTLTMSPALRLLETAILNATLVHDGHPVMAMCMANAAVSSKDASNRKLEKIRSRGRIDGAAALATGIAAMIETEDKPRDIPRIRII
jgi:phage terminase large subunit-like protein